MAPRKNLFPQNWTLFLYETVTICYFYGMVDRLENRLFSAFNDKVEEQLSKTKSHRAAFEIVNDEFEDKLGIKFYSSHEVFKNAKSRKFKKRNR